LTPLISPHCPYLPNRLKFCHHLIPKFPCRIQFFTSPNQVGNLYPCRNPLLDGDWKEASQWICPCSVVFALLNSLDPMPKKIPIVHTFWKNEFQSFAFAFGSYGTASLVSRFRVLGRIPPMQLTLSSCEKGFQCTSDKAPPKKQENFFAIEVTTWQYEACQMHSFWVFLGFHFWAFFWVMGAGALSALIVIV
jgi:hypothetical protein